MALRSVATHPSDDEPLGALVARVGDDVGRIVRAEIGLVQVRVEAAASAARATAGAIALAIVLVAAGVGALVAGVVLAIATLVPLAAWIAAASIGGTLLVLATIVGGAAMGALRRGMRDALAPVEVEVTRRGH